MNGRQEKKTMDFKIDGETIDSVELKCLVISRGLKIDKPEAVPVHEKTTTDYRPALPDGRPVLLYEDSIIARRCRYAETGFLLLRERQQ